jgi:hypothetical protein
MATARNDEPALLSVEKARRFLRQLEEDPFIALVVTDEGEVRIFSKGIEDDHLARIRDVLRTIQQEEE